MRHLSFDDLLALTEDADRERPEHLVSCRRCRDELERLAAMLGTLKGLSARAEPSEELLVRCHDLFPALPAVYNVRLLE